MQKVERHALKKLLQEYKKVVAQRDQLLQKQQESCLQMSDLKKQYEIQVRNSTEMDNKYQEKERNVKELEKLLQEKQHLLTESETENEKYRIDCAQFTKDIEQVKKKTKCIFDVFLYLIYF